MSGMRRWWWLGVLAALACDGEGTDTDVKETDTEEVDTEVEPPAVTYAEVQAIFDTSCATSGCHNGSFAPDLTSAASPDSIVGVPSPTAMGLDLVVPGDPDNSYLMHKIEGTHLEVGGAGAQMPTGGCCLSAEQIEAISSWIYNGATSD